MGKQQKAIQKEPDKITMTFEDFKLVKVVFEVQEGEEDLRPPTTIDIAGGHQYYEEEKTLHIILGVKSNDKAASYKFDVNIVGIFKFKEPVPEKAIERFARINCPAILFPFVREAVADLTRRAGFTPFLLKPINFAEFYQEKAKTAQKQPT